MARRWEVMPVPLPAWTSVTPVLDGWTGKACGWLAGVTWGGCEAPAWLYPGGIDPNRIKPKKGGRLDSDRQSDASGCPTGR